MSAGPEPHPPRYETCAEDTAWSHVTIQHTTRVHTDAWVENTTRPYHRRHLRTFLAALREQWASDVIDKDTEYEPLILRDLSSPASFHDPDAKIGDDNPEADYSTDPQP